MKREEARTEVYKIMALARNTSLKSQTMTKNELGLALTRIADQLFDLADKLNA